MRACIYLIALFSLVCVSFAWTDLDYKEVFDAFNDNYGYSYKSGDEYNKAFENFKTNVQDSVSRTTDTVEHDITPYYYMTQAEQIALLTGAVAPAAAAVATGLTEGAIAGIVIGCVGAAGLTVGGVFLGLHLKKKKEEEAADAATQTTGSELAATPVKGVDIYPSADGRHQSITARAPAIKKTYK